MLADTRNKPRAGVKEVARVPWLPNCARRTHAHLISRPTLEYPLHALVTGDAPFVVEDDGHGGHLKGAGYAANTRTRG